MIIEKLLNRAVELYFNNNSAAESIKIAKDQLTKDEKQQFELELIERNDKNVGKRDNAKSGSYSI